MTIPNNDLSAGTKIRQDEEGQLTAYTPTSIVTYTNEEILEQIGPAHTCSPGPCVAVG